MLPYGSIKSAAYAHVNVERMNFLTALYKKTLKKEAHYDILGSAP